MTTIKIIDSWLQLSAECTLTMSDLYELYYIAKSF